MENNQAPMENNQAPMPNIADLSVSQMASLKEQIDQQITAKRDGELLSLRQKIDEMIDASPFTLDEVLKAKPPRKPVQPKYRDPKNPNNTWTGRGRKPQWVVDYLDGGNDLEDALIEKAEPAKAPSTPAPAKSAPAPKAAAKANPKGKAASPKGKAASPKGAAGTG